MELVEDAHAVVMIDIDTVEEDGTAMVEVWGRKSPDGHGAFRMEVLEASEEKARGAVVVSDGENLWAFSPSENKVFIGTAEEAMELMAEREPMPKDFDPADHEHPETPEEAVQMLLEYFTVDKTGTEQVGDQSTHLLKLVPIPDQMPPEYVAVGGYLNLWIDKNRILPLALEYAGGSFGEFKVTVTDLKINQGVDESRFIFDVPADAEIVHLADLAPESLSLAEAQSSADFAVLTPTETPDGATLVDVLEVSGTIVQRYTLPGGGSFSIVQGSSDQARQPDAAKQTVVVRGVSGTLYTDDGGNQVILAWTEEDLFISIAGDLSNDQVLAIAESLQ